MQTLVTCWSACARPDTQGRSCEGAERDRGEGCVCVQREGGFGVEGWRWVRVSGQNPEIQLKLQEQMQEEPLLCLQCAQTASECFNKVQISNHVCTLGCTRRE